MKKILLILALTAYFAAGAQTPVQLDNGEGVTWTVDLAALSGADTNLYWIPLSDARTKPYSVFVRVTDSLETNNAGVYLKASPDGTNYVTIGDSLAVSDSTEAFHSIFIPSTNIAGTSFPYPYGDIYISKGAATLGTIEVRLFIPE